MDANGVAAGAGAAGQAAPLGAAGRMPASVPNTNTWAEAEEATRMREARLGTDRHTHSALPRYGFPLTAPFKCSLRTTVCLTEAKAITLAAPNTGICILQAKAKAINLAPWSTRIRLLQATAIILAAPNTHKRLSLMGVITLVPNSKAITLATWRMHMHLLRVKVITLVLNTHKRLSRAEVTTLAAWSTRMRQQVKVIILAPLVTCMR
jgi:hypothetical protein